MTGIPGGYGQIISAEMRPAASRHGTLSVAPRNASRGSITLSVRSAEGSGTSGMKPAPLPDGCASTSARQGADQPVDGIVVVGVGDERHQPAMVGELDMDP